MRVYTVEITPIIHTNNSPLVIATVEPDVVEPDVLVAYVAYVGDWIIKLDYKSQSQHCFNLEGMHHKNNISFRC